MNYHNTIQAIHTITGYNPSRIDVQRILNQYTKDVLLNCYNESVEAITSIGGIVCNYYNKKRGNQITMIDIKGKNRKREIVEPRQVIAFFYNEIFRYTYREAAAIINKNPGSTFKACINISNLCETNSTVRQYITEIRQQIIEAKNSNLIEIDKI